MTASAQQYTSPSMVLPPDCATQDNLQCKASNATHVLFYKPMTTPSHSYPQMPTGLPDLEPELLSTLNAHIDALRAAMHSPPEGPPALRPHATSAARQS